MNAEHKILDCLDGQVYRRVYSEVASVCVRTAVRVQMPLRKTVSSMCGITGARVSLAPWGAQQLVAEQLRDLYGALSHDRVEHITLEFTV